MIQLLHLLLPVRSISLWIVIIIIVVVVVVAVFADVL